jgi:hypothetical protein
MLSDLNETERKLANFMSAVSERCFYAGWMKNLEHVLWYALQNGPIKYGHDHVTEDDVELLKKLSNNANCWIIFDGTLEETAISLSAWATKYKRDLEHDPEILMI